MRIGLPLSSLLVLAAVVLFVLDAVSVRLGTLALIPLGLACFAASFLFGRGPFGLRT